MLEWILMALALSQPNGPLPDQTSSQSVIERLELAPLPVKPAEKVAPQLLKSPNLTVWAQDLGSGKVLFTKSPTKPRPIASLSKIMTYLVISDHYDPDEVVTIPLTATQTSGASLGLYANETMTVQTLLQGLLIPSGNDAAVALAIHHAGSEEAFVTKMNQAAKKLGLNSAQFYNATGLDVVSECETGSDCPKPSGNLMSAQDVSIMARLAWRDPFFRETVRQTLFRGTSADQEFVHEKPTTNKLLGEYPDSVGIKTGYTRLAGQCLVHLTQDENNREILTVILGSSDRFTETTNLLDWIKGSFVWR